MFENLPYNQERVFTLLQDLDLSDHARELIKLSFRTRVKQSWEEMMSMQFRILPERISPVQEKRLDQVRDEIATKLKNRYPTEPIDVVMQVAPCCGSECFGCRQFGR